MHCIAQQLSHALEGKYCLSFNNIQCMHWTSCVQWNTNGQCLDFTALWNIKKQHHRVSALKYSCMRNIELYKPSPQWKVTVSKLKEGEESAQTGWLLREQTRFTDLLRWRFYTCTNNHSRSWLRKIQLITSEKMAISVLCRRNMNQQKVVQ